ncbi:cysteine--tRNA ligase [Elusimicrobiota bacterium]
MNIKLYNSLTNRKEEFKPLNPPEVKMYVCGITPYGETHLGHGRCYVVFDTLKRFLNACDYNVRYIQNITDIDDKIINKSKEEGKTIKEIADYYFKGFKENMKQLNVTDADEYPKVSATIAEIIDFIDLLIEKNAAYTKNGSVYFRINSLSNYGRLSGRNPDDLLSQSSATSDEKDDSRDFALWKEDEEFGWESPWGLGRPGWHIECSAMSKKYLGEEFDIHGGGQDLKFPHHENELAQSYAAYGKEPVKYWIHNGMVTIKGDKMSKSTGNYFLLNELLEQFNPQVVRLYLLSAGYRQPLDFNIEGFEDHKKAYDKLSEFKKLLSDVNIGEPIDKVDTNLLEILADDFNTARALGEVFKKINPVMDDFINNKFPDESLLEGQRVINFVEKVLGIELGVVTEVDADEIRIFIDKRNEARKNRDFGLADSIRDELLEMGIELKDTSEGTKWFKKSD